MGLWQIVSGVLAMILLLGGSFAAGTKWQHKALPESETAAVTATDATTSEIKADPDAALYKVLRVVDGDTIAVEINGKSETVRMIGIDTPELHDSRTGVQCFAKEAAAEATSLLSGRKVSLESDSSQAERDKYKRLLAYVFRDDGVFINEQLIVGGFAHEYTYDTPYKYQKEFKDAEKEARESETGLWSPSKCPTTPQKRSSAPTPSKQAAAAASAIATQSIEPPVQKAVEKTAPIIEKVVETPAPQIIVTPQPIPTPPPPPPPVAPPAQTAAPSSSFDVSGYTCSSNTYNCTDFKTQSEAQAVYDKCGGVSNDVHKLDKNKDGHPCDSLP